MSKNSETPPMQTENLAPAKKQAWSESGPKKDSSFYEQQRQKYEKYLQGNEFLTIPEALEAVNTKVISMLSTDIKSRRHRGSESMEETLKSLKIIPKVLA